MNKCGLNAHCKLDSCSGCTMPAEQASISKPILKKTNKAYEVLYFIHKNAPPQRAKYLGKYCTGSYALCKYFKNALEQLPKADQKSFYTIKEIE